MLDAVCGASTLEGLYSAVGDPEIVDDQIHGIASEERLDFEELKNGIMGMPRKAQMRKRSEEIWNAFRSFYISKLAEAIPQLPDSMQQERVRALIPLLRKTVSYNNLEDTIAIELSKIEDIESVMEADIYGILPPPDVVVEEFYDLKGQHFGVSFEELNAALDAVEAPNMNEDDKRRQDLGMGPKPKPGINKKKTDFDPVPGVAMEDPNKGGDLSDTILDLYEKYQETKDPQIMEEIKNLSKHMAQRFTRAELDRRVYRRTLAQKLRKAGNPTLLVKREAGGSKNHMGERCFKTYEAWKRAVKAIDPDAKFDGDKDICFAGKIGEWDGVEGCIYGSYKKEASKRKSQRDLKLGDEISIGTDFGDTISGTVIELPDEDGVFIIDTGQGNYEAHISQLNEDMEREAQRGYYDQDPGPENHITKQDLIDAEFIQDGSLWIDPQTGEVVSLMQAIEIFKDRQGLRGTSQFQRDRLAKKHKSQNQDPLHIWWNELTGEQQEQAKANYPNDTELRHRGFKIDSSGNAFVVGPDKKEPGKNWHTPPQRKARKRTASGGDFYNKSEGEYSLMGWHENRGADTPSFQSITFFIEKDSQEDDADSNIVWTSDDIDPCDRSGEWDESKVSKAIERANRVLTLYATGKRKAQNAMKPPAQYGYSSQPSQPSQPSQSTGQTPPPPNKQPAPGKNLVYNEQTKQWEEVDANKVQ